MTNFLGYLRDWRTQVEAVPGLSRSEIAVRQLSRETLEGLNITGAPLDSNQAHPTCNLVRSFVELVRYFLPSKD